MLVQLLFFVLVIFFYWILKFSKIENKHISFVVFVCILLILQSGLRGVSVGADTYEYMNQYMSVADMSWNDVWNNFYEVYINNRGKDAGYVLVEKLCQCFFGVNYQLFLLFIAIVFFSAFGRFLYRNTKTCDEVLFAVIIYQAIFYGFMSITGIRQTIAMAFSLFAFEFVKEKRWWYFFIVVMISSFIHKSSIAFLVTYFVCQIPNERFVLVISFLGGILLFPFGRNFAAFLIEVTGTDNYSSYIINSYETQGAQTFAILMAIILIGLFIYGKLMVFENSNSRFYIKIFSLGILFTPFTWIDPSMMRLVQYFSIFMVLLLPSIYRQIELINKPIGRGGYFLTLLFFILLTLSRNNYYVFFWEEGLI